MIIGISGRAGSGKDTVGGIIQYLTFCKDYNRTDVSYEDFTNSVGWVPTWEIKKFAGKLKTIASLLTGVPVEMFEDQEFKQKYMPEDWNNPNPVIYENGNKAWMPMTYREFLQKLGTEAMRDGLHTNVWVNVLFADYKDVYIGSWGQGNHMYEKPNWILTDIRFPNEMEAVKEREGITIRVVRPKIESLVDKMRPYSDLFHYGIPMPVEHTSETDLDNAKFDYVIENDGTLDELVEKVRAILIREKIIS